MLNYQRLGTGDPVILIHGLFGSLENLNMVAKPLSEHYTVISVDVRNHGSSFHSDEMNYSLMADDIIEVMDSLNIDSASVLGHSMGGKIAMRLALDAPSRVNKLIVADIAPVTYSPSHLAIIEGLNAIDLAATSKRSDADKTLSNYVPLLSTRQFLLKNLAFNENKAHWRCNLDGIAKNYETLLKGFDADESSVSTLDTLFIKGGDSDYIGPQHREKIMTMFPRAKAKIVQGTGHWLHAEKPAIFNKIVFDFLSTAKNA